MSQIRKIIRKMDQAEDPRVAQVRELSTKILEFVRDRWSNVTVDVATMSLLECAVRLETCAGISTVEAIDNIVNALHVIRKDEVANSHTVENN